MKRLLCAAALALAACTPVGEAPPPPSGRALGSIDDGTAAFPPPDTSFTSTPPAYSNLEPNVFAFTSDDPAATFECSLDSAPFTPCASPLSLPGLSDAPHVLTVRAVDSGNTPDPTPATHAWTVDRTPPNGSLATGPSLFTSSPNALFVQAAAEPVTWHCALDGAALAPCPPDVVYSGLAAGPHTFTSRATDLAGNVDATPTVFAWTIDLTPPDTGFLAAPPAATTSTSASFSLWSDDPPSTFECRLDGAPFTACVSPVNLAGLSEGPHTFEARARDAAGNLDPSPATHTWRVDTTGPAVTFTTAPAALVNTTSASFFFEANEAPATFECSLDGAAFAGCTPLVTRTGLAAGTHTFSVRARDALGNLTAPPASSVFTVDLTAPNTSFTSTPLNGSAGSVTFSFTATEASTFECSLDGAEFGTPPVFAPCGSPRPITGLTPGSHTFRVRARDLAGNLDATEASHTWTVGAASTSGAWLLRTAQGFAYHPVAWDGTRSRVAAFGGGTPNALWHWDGSTLDRSLAASPSDRQNAAMVWDATRSRLVLFGGYAFIALADTWEWNGTTWTQRAPATSPSARTMHAMAFDAVRGRVVLFGGSVGGADVADTWEWDGTTWSQRVVAGPSARHNHAMAWDPVRQRVVLFAGESTSTGILRDTWEWDGTTWTLRHSTGPTRFAHAMAWDGTSSRLIVFGGFNAGNQQDTWAWNGTTWSNLGLTGPSARREAGMAFDSARSRLVLIGGYSSFELEDVWEFDGAAWSRRTGTGAPPRRYDLALAYDSARARTVLFGGSAQQGDDPLGDTWEWTGGGWTQRAIAGPSVRQHHAMAFDATRAVTVLFGGLEDWPYLARYKGDTWTYDGAAWTQRAVAGPSPRHSHALVWDAARQRVVLFGGRDGYGIFDETWEWDGAAWTKRTLSPSPPARFSHQMAYDAARGRVVLYGGIGYRGIVFSDTWEFDGVAWTQASSDGPAPLFDAAMAWDGARSQVVLMGGQTPRSQYETLWTWNGTSWTATTATGPGTRMGHAMVWDSVRGRVVLFGYDVLGVVAQTWEYF